MFLKVLDICKKYCLNFQSTQSISFFFFLLFCFGICKTVDKKYSTDDYKSSKITIGTVMENPNIKICF